MASPPPRIHTFSDVNECFRLVDNNKYSEFDAYLVATCRIGPGVLVSGEPLDALPHQVHGHAVFLPGRRYPQPGAKPDGVWLHGCPLALGQGRAWIAWDETSPLAPGLAEPLVWRVKAGDGVLDFEAVAPAFPEPYVITSAPSEIPIAETCEISVTAERARLGGTGLPAADLLGMAVTFQLPRDPPTDRPGYHIRQNYAGPIEGDLYALTTRLEHLFPDKPPNYAPGPASAVVRALRRVEQLVKPSDFDPAGVQRVLVVSIVEAEVPLVWRA